MTGRDRVQKALYGRGNFFLGVSPACKGVAVRVRDGHVSPKPWSTELICFQISRRYYGFACDGRRISGGDVFPVTYFRSGVK